MPVGIAGIGETAVGTVPESSALDLYVESIVVALADAGLGLDEVDCLITMNSRTDPHLYHAEYVAEVLGIRPRVAYTLQTGGGTTVGAIAQVAARIEQGEIGNAVLAAADNIRSGLSSGGTVTRMASEVGHPEWEAPYFPTVPAMYALIARRHMYEYGTTREQLAAVTVAAREFGAQNPQAQVREPVTIEQVTGSKMIADPLGKLDCSLISDGGGAVVLFPGEGHSAQVIGAAEGHDYEYVSQATSLTTTAAVDSGRAAFAQAGLGTDAVDVAFLYDAFTILPVLFVEDLGFCAKGEGGPFVADGNLTLEGALPTNPHGGMLSFCHPGRSGAMLMITQAVRQLRGTATAQVADPEIALVHAEGGVASSHGTLLLQRGCG